jgi:hypothetical protein
MWCLGRTPIGSAALRNRPFLHSDRIMLLTSYVAVCS